MVKKTLIGTMLAAAFVAAPAGSVSVPSDTLGGVQAYVQGWLGDNGYRGYSVFKISAFAAGDYLAIADRSGKPAFELQFVPQLRTVAFEPQSKYWNTRYGISKGLGFADASTRNLPPAGGKALASAWLRSQRSGEVVAPGGRSFPGYYTFDTFLPNGGVGMMSVDSSTGAVWYHNWHGRFLAARAY